MLKTKKISVFLSVIMAIMVAFVFSVSPALAEDKNSELTPMEKVKYERMLAGEDDEDYGYADGDPYETGQGVHADPATFEKDFSLTPEQKAYTITEMEKVVSEIIDPEMSDLEKYYTLAIWVNKHVEYDWEFWAGRYYFEYYSHQWDSYGGMKEDEKSVCAGIAIFYANMCHAAGLPCKFLRLNPKYLDHTINYIPDINGHAYLVDVTEDVFLMSEQSSSAFTHLDKAFSNITQDANDETFDYSLKDDDSLVSSSIKDYYDTPFADWFNEYALHNGTDADKVFNTPYEEKGSGVRGENYASYANYDSNRTNTPGLWFMDDFYKDPADVSTKVLAGQLDDQVTSVLGIKKGYDCDSKESLEELVNNDINVQYFPSAENGTVVPKIADLQNGVDYTVTVDSFDLEGKTAQITVTGINNYSGTQTCTVAINSAVVDKAPVRKAGLSYDGKSQELIVKGEALNGEMQYAFGNDKEPTGEFSTKIPKATDAGKYYIWYKVVGDAAHGESVPQLIDPVASIAPKEVYISVGDDMSLKLGESAKIEPSLDVEFPVVYSFSTTDSDIIKIDENGVVTALSEGFATIFVRANLKYASSNYAICDEGIIIVEVKSSGFDISETKVRLSKSSFVYNGKVQKPTIKTVKGMTLQPGEDYDLIWSNKSSKNVGKYTVVVCGKGNYVGETDATYTIVKANNPMTLKAKSVNVGKKTKKIKRAKTFTVSNVKGKCSYKLVSVKKGKKNVKKSFKINTKTGNLTVKKALTAGTYVVKVKVKDSGNKNYKASSWKPVTFKVNVK